jgi:hypothetical protein
VNPRNSGYFYLNGYHLLYFYKVVIYERETVNRSKMEVKTAVMDVTGFLCVSLGSSTIQLHDSLGSRRACECSEVGFSIQNGDCV